MRTRTVITLLAGMLLALAAGCGEDEPAAGHAADGATACEAVEHPPVQSGQHLIEGHEPPVAYSSTPPTSGWHAAGAFDIDVRDADDPLSEPEQVSVLEAEAVVVTYRGLGDGQVTTLESVVAERFPGRVALTPYDGLEPGQVAFTAWGALQRCDGVDVDALEAFVDEHAHPEPVTPGTHGHDG